MATFQYAALDEGGRKQSGVHEADSVRLARQALREKGWTLLSVEPVAVVKDKKQFSWTLQSKLKFVDLVLITRHLATLLRVGMPVDVAFDSIVQQQSVVRNKTILLGIRARILEGDTLADALKDEGASFPNYYIAMVKAGEHSGKLGLVLEQLADYMEGRQGLQQKVMLSLLYPMMVSVVAVLVIVMLLTYVVPEIVAVFEDTGQALPGLTLGLIAVSEFLQHHGGKLLVFIVSFIVLFKLLMQRPGFVQGYDRFLLFVPIISHVHTTLAASQFTRTFGILLQSGVEALDAMKISTDVIKSVSMKMDVTNATEKVREGTSIKDAMSQSKYFPPIVLDMIGIGEASGSLGEMMERAGDNQEKELEIFLAKLMGLFEPVLLIVMGGIVLTIVLAILLPIFELNQLVSA